ncbi:MAG: UDP-N-acetylglucosamine 4,6-dehydratase (inverting) [Phycisphaerae bacterium]|nr:UDP-N-acetylglucosamine 4,6-dehydratase (inverting) [Phycisphaerae bacterium]MDD5381833.1 UDP-N-acetylglucosamine 4,6-dehydratase (inverting) [Phycisphaerae bacterium]
MLNGKIILITGGTGSFGQAFAKRVLAECGPRKVIVYSRDEYKQYMMREKFEAYKEQIRFFLGDVRDKSRLLRAFEGVDYVVHAAALKQVPALEYNPTEAVNTNVMGANNIVDAAIDTGVKKVIALSTDKAVSPINLYGATKLVAEKIFIAANAYSGGKVRFSVVRYGNVMGSRGSVVPLFLGMKVSGIKEFPITDERMTRFWITLEQGVELVMKALKEAEGGEIFVPKIPSMKITDLARAIEPNCTFRYTGIRPGEKLHETLISYDESRSVKIFDGMYVIVPRFFESMTVDKRYAKYPSVPEGFVFQSNVNDMWLSQDQLRQILKAIEVE